MIITEQVSPHTHLNVKRTMKNMPDSEAKTVFETNFPLIQQYDIKDEAWVLNSINPIYNSKSLPTVVVAVHPKKPTQSRASARNNSKINQLHHDCLRPCKAREAKRTP